MYRNYTFISNTSNLTTYVNNTTENELSDIIITTISEFMRLNIIDIVFAVLGIIPTFYAVINSRYFIAIVILVSFVIAVCRASAVVEKSDQRSIAVLSAIDAVNGVLLTLLIAFYVSNIRLIDNIQI